MRVGVIYVIPVGPYNARLYIYMLQDTWNTCVVMYLLTSGKEAIKLVLIFVLAMIVT